MAVVSIPLAQALVDLEVRGATGRFVITTAGGQHVLEVVHGRLGVVARDATDVLYAHGLAADDTAADEVAAVDVLADRLAAAMADPDVTWSFTDEDVQPTGSTPTSVVVRDARRRLAESERLAIQMPGDDLAPDRVAEARTRGVHVSRLIGNVYAAVDGERTIARLADDLGIALEAARRSVFRLFTLGLVSFDARETPLATHFVPTTDWAADSLAEAIEEPEPWVGYANGGSSPETSTSRRPRRTSTRPRLTPTHGPSDEEREVMQAGDPASAEVEAPRRTTSVPDRRRPADPEEQRESLRQAAAWLADIDHHDPAPEPEATPEPEPTVAAPEPEPAQREVLERTMPAEDISDFLRELSQLSRDED